MKGLAKQIREIMKELAPAGDISYTEITRRLDLTTDHEKQPVYSAIRDFIKRGECIRIAPGVVRYVVRFSPKPARKTSCMYRLIRANRTSTVSAADLVANCSVSEITARQYLQMLTNRGITRRIDMPNNQPARYQMINDPGPNLIRNDRNAEKLRRIRAAKKEAMDRIEAASAALENASRALAQARDSMSVIESQAKEECS